jgi:hypothetical protein
MNLMAEEVVVAEEYVQMTNLMNWMKTTMTQDTP